MDNVAHTRFAPRIVILIAGLLVILGVLLILLQRQDGQQREESSAPASLATPPPIEEAVRVNDPCYLQAREGFVTDLAVAAQKEPGTVCFLILNGQGLVSLPPAVGAYPNLRTLDVSDNQLSQLPSLRSLQRLETLILRGNQLTAVPAFVYELPALKYVDLRNNPLSEAVKREVQGRMRSGVDVAM